MQFQLLSPRAANRAFCAMAVAYALVLGALSVLRHFTFNTAGHDLGIFDQLVWNSLRGRLFEVSILPDTPVVLGQHFSVMMLAFVPLYALWSDPIVLLVVQTLGIATGAFPIFWFARERIGHGLALVVAVAYFLFPALQWVNLFQFHEIALAIPLLSFATFFLLRRMDKPFLILLVVSLLVKEEIAFIPVAIGVYLFLIQRRRALGLTLAMAGAIWTVVLLQYIIPFFRGSEFNGGYYYFGSGIDAGKGRYDYLGGSLGEIAMTLVTRPAYVLQNVLTAPKIEFTLLLLAPLAFLPLVGADVALMLTPILGASLLSNYAPQFSIYYHYTAAMIPCLFYAAVVGVERILKAQRQDTQRIQNSESKTQNSKKTRARSSALAVLLFASSSALYYLQAPGPFAQQFRMDKYQVDAHDARGREFLRAIPPDASVVAQSELVPHLTQRARAYEMPAIPDMRQADYLIGDKTRLWYNVHRGFWESWLATEYFEIVREQDGYFIAKRRALANTRDLHFDDGLTLRGYTIPITTTLRGGMTMRPIVEWRADRALTERYVVNVHLLDSRRHVWARDDREPQDGNLPTRAWEPGAAVGDQYALVLPSTMPPGEYRLTVSVCDAREQCLRAHEATGADRGDEPMLATVRIEKDKSSITASQLPIEFPYFVDMGELRLLGYAGLPTQGFTGETLPLGIYWRARSKPRGDYAVAVQLRDASGRVALEESARPAGGTYPTAEWDEGEVLLDWHDLAIPPNFKTGEYQMVVILRAVAGQITLGETRVGAVAVGERKP